MSGLPVEAVWVWRFTTAPFKATYGRLGSGSTTYSKDFLQASGECAESLGELFHRSAEQTIDIRFLWPDFDTVIAKALVTEARRRVFVTTQA